MANKVRFLINNLIDTTTLDTSPSLISTLPIDNVKVLSKSQVARSSTNSTIEISGIFSTEDVISGFIIGNHNFTEGVGYRLQLFSQPDFTVELYDSTSLTVSAAQEALDPDNFQYNIPIWFIDISNASSFKLSISNSVSNPIDYFQIGRLFVGKVIEMRVGASFGNLIYWKDLTKQYRTEAGTLRSDIITPSKMLEFTLNNIAESERSDLQRSLATIGMRDEFFISVFPENCTEEKQLDYSGIVKMIKIPKYSEYAPSWYSSKYIVEEV